MIIRIMKTKTHFLWLCSGEGERARGDAAGTKEVYIIYMYIVQCTLRTGGSYPSGCLFIAVASYVLFSFALNRIMSGHDVMKLISEMI